MSILEMNTNHKLYYRLIEGRSGGPYLVFLHEGLGCTAMWKGFPEVLCEMTGCPGLVYDRLGYGRSSSSGCTRTIHYMHEYALQELPMLLQSIIPDTPHVLIGHSDGGSISLIYGAERPAGLQAIITEAAHVFVEPETIAGIRVADEAWESGNLNGLFKYHGDKTEAMFKAWADTWLSSWFLYWNIEYLLPGIEVPLLVLQGDSDTYGSEAQVNSIVSQSSGEAQLEIVEGCGHIPHLQAQHVVRKRMTDFIAHICNHADV